MAAIRGEVPEWGGSGYDCRGGFGFGGYDGGDLEKT